MRKTKKVNQPVSIVMIAYNEAKSIARVIEEYVRDIYKKLPSGSEFIIYLDSPTDGTPLIVKELAKKNKLTIIHAKKNLGYAQAMKKALARAKNDVIFYSDSSGKHQAKDFWQLLPFIKKFDIVTGERTQRTDPLIRQIITFFQRLIAVLLFQVPFYDYNTGFKILKKEVVQKVAPLCRYTKQSFSTELCIRAIKKGYSITNVPVHFSARKHSGQGTHYKQLLSIIGLNLKGLFKLKQELT